VDQIVAVGDRIEGGVIETVPIFERRGADLAWTGLRPPRMTRYEAAAASLDEVH
jgi:hypothetical protein